MYLLIFHGFTTIFIDAFTWNNSSLLSQLHKHPFFLNIMLNNECRLKKQELESLANSGVDVLQAVEESVKKELSGSLKAALHAVSEQPLKPPCERAKIVISVQDKDELKQFRIYKVYMYMFQRKSNRIFRFRC